MAQQVWSTKVVTDKRETILRAAIKVFVQKGYFSSKIADVATEAGISDGTVYLYFTCKDEILHTILSRVMEEYIADKREIEKIIDVEDIIDKMRLELLKVLTLKVLTKEHFLELAEKWYLETLHSSGYLDKVLHPAYQRIIGMGKDVIPFILRELQDEPSEWFWALRALTGEDPTTEEMAGNREKLAEAWLNWGKENGYILDVLNHRKNSPARSRRKNKESFQQPQRR
jgi:AcrR family transcriptional regulator